jgi:hypothetical protein
MSKSDDTISRQAAIDALAEQMPQSFTPDGSHPADEGIFRAQEIYADCIQTLKELPAVHPERKWIPCSNPPKHHKDVIVRGIEAIGNVTVHKVMQWDVDTWRPTDYAPSVMWKEWSEI